MFHWTAPYLYRCIVVFNVAVGLRNGHRVSYWFGSAALSADSPRKWKRAFVSVQIHFQDGWTFVSREMGVISRAQDGNFSINTLLTEDVWAGWSLYSTVEISISKQGMKSLLCLQHCVFNVFIYVYSSWIYFRFLRKICVCPPPQL